MTYSYWFYNSNDRNNDSDGGDDCDNINTSVWTSQKSVYLLPYF